MPDWSDNGFYLLLGLLAFWLPVAGYWLWLRAQKTRLEQEEELLHEELERAGNPGIRG